MSGEPFEIIRPEQLGVERFEGMAAMYDVKELAAVLKPLVLNYLLERDGEPVACVDADVRFFADIDEIARLTASEPVMLTPHGGFIVLAPGDDAGRLIDWWRGRERFSRDEVSRVVSRFHVIRDPGVNVGYWSLDEERWSAEVQLRGERSPSSVVSLQRLRSGSTVRAVDTPGADPAPGRARPGRAVRGVRVRAARRGVQLGRAAALDVRRAR